MLKIYETLYNTPQLHKHVTCYNFCTSDITPNDGGRLLLRCSLTSCSCHLVLTKTILFQKTVANLVVLVLLHCLYCALPRQKNLTTWQIGEHLPVVFRCRFSNFMCLKILNDRVFQCIFLSHDSGRICQAQIVKEWFREHEI